MRREHLVIVLGLSLAVGMAASVSAKTLVYLL